MFFWADSTSSLTGDAGRTSSLTAAFDAAVIAMAAAVMLLLLACLLVGAGARGAQQMLLCGAPCHY
jgi:hypothetical protein